MAFDKVSPVVELRQKFGLTRTELANALQVKYDLVYQAEVGRSRIPKKARAALAELGIDYDDLNKRQDEWAEERARCIRAEVLARVGKGANVAVCEEP